MQLRFRFRLKASLSILKLFKIILFVYFDRDHFVVVFYAVLDAVIEGCNTVHVDRFSRQLIALDHMLLPRLFRHKLVADLVERLLGAAIDLQLRLALILLSFIIFDFL